MNIKARAKILIILFCILLLLSLGAITYAARTTKDIVNINLNYEGAGSIEEFMNIHHNGYLKYNFEKIENYPFSFIMKPKNDDKYIKTYEINNTKIAIHLLVCKREHNGCTFRINGIVTDWFQPSTDKIEHHIKLENGYALKINNIIFDYCGKRFCDYQRELYDIINMSIIKE